MVRSGVSSPASLSSNVQASFNVQRPPPVSSNFNYAQNNLLSQPQLLLTSASAPAHTRSPLPPASSLSSLLPPLAPELTSATPIAAHSKLLEVYYKHPLDLLRVISMDLFRGAVALPNTVFEETESCAHFEVPFVHNPKDDLDDDNYPYVRVKRICILKC